MLKLLEWIGIGKTYFSLDQLVSVRKPVRQPFHSQLFGLSRLDCPVHVRVIPQEIE